VRKAYRSSLLGWIVASINIVGITGEYNNEDRTTNLDSRAPRVGLKAVFREGVYTRGGLFLLGREGFMRGA